MRAQTQARIAFLEGPPEQPHAPGQTPPAPDDTAGVKDRAERLQRIQEGLESTLFSITHEGSERIIAEHERRVAEIEGGRGRERPGSALEPGVDRRRDLLPQGLRGREPGRGHRHRARLRERLLWCRGRAGGVHRNRQAGVPEPRRQHPCRPRAHDGAPDHHRPARRCSAERVRRRRPVRTVS